MTDLTTRLQSLRSMIMTALFAALAAALGFALVEIPNVELITFTVFMAGVLLGVRSGLLVGLIGEGLFSGLNPLGSGLAIPPLFLAQIISFALIGAVGGLIGKRLVRLPFWVIGLTGALLTLFYELLAALATVLVFGVGEQGLLAYLILGIPWSAIHLGLNFIVFAFLSRPVIRLIGSRAEVAR
ncbi:MAG: hypothetical protein ISR91_02475 [Candidatus Delongbacteria bacterium]|nr:hypothetical protein [Candidatus Delongbacteria bacterium]